MIYLHGSHQENVFFAIFYSIIFTFSVPCNFLALYVFCRGKSCSPSKVFLLNLALADMSYVLILPMRVIYHVLDSHWPLGEALCRLTGFLFFLNLYCSIYFMTFISLDRLMAVIMPIKCQTLRRNITAKVGCGVLWLIVTCSMVPLLFNSQTVTQSLQINVTICSHIYLENSSQKAHVSTAVAIAIPVVTLTVSYILIFYKLKLMTFQERTSIQCKAMKMIFLTVVTFLIAFVPYHVHRFIYINRYKHVHISEMRSLAFGNRLTSALTCVSGIMDPVMYFFLASNYQKTLLQMCGKATNHDKPQSTF